MFWTLISGKRAGSASSASVVLGIKELKKNKHIKFPGEGMEDVRFLFSQVLLPVHA